MGRSCSYTRDDTYSPDWNDQVLIAAISATELKAGISVDLMDADVLESDTICTGTAFVTDSDLKAHELLVTCGNGAVLLGLRP